MDVRYLEGDATRPVGEGPKVIAHICNDLGGWGAGFVLAVSKRWPSPEASYRAWHRAGEGFALGETQLVEVEPELWVANMVAQKGVRPSQEGPPIRYDALDACLARLSSEASARGASVHMPRIGCGLAGGEWGRVEPIVRRQLTERGVAVFVYDWIGR